MGARVLLVFYTSEGQTARIAERIAETIRRLGHEVDVEAVEHAPVPEGYDAVIVGDPIHATRHTRSVVNYVRDHAELLNAKPSAFFQVSLTSVNPEPGHTARAQDVVRRFLDDTGFDPDVVGLFAGALVYTKYGWLKRRIMVHIVRAEGGDTDTSHDYEYTDWDAVDGFARDVARLVSAHE
jgi:menaquinone-dependent protoporphyrinogen oxidase